MKIGIFDSGLGGLLITKAVRERIPDVDIIYFGDTLHLPYGNRSAQAIYEYSKRAISFLFEQDCNLIITACNTVSAKILRRLQQEYLPNSPYSDRRILGVVVPTLECAIDRGYKKVGIIATNYTIQSNIFPEELNKIDPSITIIQQNTPLLVPLIENDGEEWIEDVLTKYLSPIKNDIECLILGCTLYPFIKSKFQSVLGQDIAILSQDEIIPEKLEDYLKRHPEISDQLSRNASNKFYVSDLTQGYEVAARKIYDHTIKIEPLDFSAIDNTYSVRT